MLKPNNDNTKVTRAWGGHREGAGRPVTGRRKRNFYITDDEYKKMQKYLAQLRQEDKK